MQQPDERGGRGARGGGSRSLSNEITDGGLKCQLLTFLLFFFSELGTVASLAATAPEREAKQRKEATTHQGRTNAKRLDAEEPPIGLIVIPNRICIIHTHPIEGRCMYVGPSPPLQLNVSAVLPETSPTRAASSS